MFISWPDLFWCVNDTYLRRFCKKRSIRAQLSAALSPSESPLHTCIHYKRKAALFTNILICEYLHVKVRHNWIHLDSDLSHLTVNSRYGGYRCVFSLNIPPLKAQDLWGSKKKQQRALCVHVSRSPASLSAFLPYWLRLQEALHQNLVQDRSLEANCGQSPVAVWHMVTICH